MLYGFCIGKKERNCVLHFKNEFDILNSKSTYFENGCNKFKKKADLQS